MQQQNITSRNNDTTFITISSPATNGNHENKEKNPKKDGKSTMTAITLKLLGTAILSVTFIVAVTNCMGNVNNNYLKNSSYLKRNLFSAQVVSVDGYLRGSYHGAQQQYIYKLFEDGRLQINGFELRSINLKNVIRVEDGRVSGARDYLFLELSMKEGFGDSIIMRFYHASSLDKLYEGIRTVSNKLKLDINFSAKIQGVDVQAGRDMLGKDKSLLKDMPALEPPQKGTIAPPSTPLKPPVDENNNKEMLLERLSAFYKTQTQETQDVVEGDGQMTTAEEEHAEETQDVHVKEGRNMFGNEGYDSSRDLLKDMTAGRPQDPVVFPGMP